MSRQALDPYIPTEVSLVDATQRLGSKAAAYVDSAMSPNTRRAYASRIASFAEWATIQAADGSHHDPESIRFLMDIQDGRPPGLPIPTPLLADWLADLASYGASYGTIKLSMTAMNWLYRSTGFLPLPKEEPILRALLRGIARTEGNISHQSKPILLEHLGLMLDSIDEMKYTPLSKEGRKTLLTVGWFGAFRRSELVGVDISHLQFQQDRCLVTIPSSKTSPGEAHHVPLVDPPGWNHLGPVASLQRWIESSEIQSGPVFRSVTKTGSLRNTRTTPQMVNLITKECMEVVAQSFGRQELGANAEFEDLEAWISESQWDPEDYSAHGLRAGYVTEARNRGVADRLIMQQTRHRDMRALSIYDRPENTLDSNATLSMFS